MNTGVRGKEGGVSVVLPTYNSAKHLSACLETLKRQTYPPLEVLVVDNHSADATQQVAQSFGAKVIAHRGTQASARNRGIEEATGEFVFFVDSDQRLEPEVVASCVQLCTGQGVDAVKIPEEFVGVNFWGKCSALWKNTMVTAWGVNGGIPRFYRRDVLVRQAAFHDELRWWEDMELYGRLKTSQLKVAWSAGRVLHSEADSPQNAVRKYLSYGESIVSFTENHAEAPYKGTLKLTLSTLMRLLRSSGSSLSVLVGCLFLVTVKSLSATLGFLSRLK